MSSLMKDGAHAAVLGERVRLSWRGRIMPLHWVGHYKVVGEACTAYPNTALAT
jgi:hypothetical protein